MTGRPLAVPRELLIELAELGLTAPEIFARLPQGSFKSARSLGVIVSKLRASGRIAAGPSPGRRPPPFSINALGEDYWRKLVAASAGRGETPWGLAARILRIVLDEPVLLANLLDETDDREAAE